MYSLIVESWFYDTICLLQSLSMESKDFFIVIHISILYHIYIKDRNRFSKLLKGFEELWKILLNWRYESFFFSFTNFTQKTCLTINYRWMFLELFWMKCPNQVEPIFKQTKSDFISFDCLLCKKGKFTHFAVNRKKQVTLK